MKRLSIITGLFVAMSAVGAEPAYVHVGEISAVCPIVIKGGAMPPGFRIQPQQAIELAAKHAPVKCNSIFEQSVFADANNYYIIKSAFGPMTPNVDAVAIDGRSGRVTERKHK